ncbi:hypothetical protein Clacol_008654 [Clathrus columnatus]|uniref:Uncharacterized protein n=1 Tax=Clathrus columnatus TaxID=1419009 RepID=A0AAV5ANH9_9AGAM|nr:hypothetical protein Clacol_008654 [Clathrus columnatus]
MLIGTLDPTTVIVCDPKLIVEPSPGAEGEGVGMADGVDDGGGGGVKISVWDEVVEGGEAGAGGVVEETGAGATGVGVFKAGREPTRGTAGDP